MAAKGAKKEAKIASDAAARASAPKMLQRFCEHCGEQIASNAVQAVRALKFDERGKNSDRVVFYTKGHWGA